MRGTMYIVDRRCAPYRMYQTYVALIECEAVNPVECQGQMQSAVKRKTPFINVLKEGSTENGSHDQVAERWKKLCNVEG